MYINKNSFKVNNVNLGTYLTDIQYNYPKLWSANSGRALSGRFSGTLLGIYPKFVLNFKPLNQSELEVVATILDAASQSVYYYDPNKKAYKTISTYSGDWATRCKNIGENEAFSVSLIAIDRRR